MSARNLAPGPMDVPRGASSALLPARQYRDLCSTCNHVKACARSTPERPIFFCEQFEAFIPASAAAVERLVPVRAIRGRKRGASERRGLCMNCDNAETCPVTMPEGGVWHCEEYR